MRILLRMMSKITIVYDFPLAFIKMSTISQNGGYFTICRKWADDINNKFCSIVTPHHLIIKVFPWRSNFVASYLKIGDFAFKMFMTTEIWLYPTICRKGADHVNDKFCSNVTPCHLIIKFFPWRLNFVASYLKIGGFTFKMFITTEIWRYPTICRDVLHL